MRIVALIMVVTFVDVISGIFVFKEITLPFFVDKMISFSDNFEIC